MSCHGDSKSALHASGERPRCYTRLKVSNYSRRPVYVLFFENLHSDFRVKISADLLKDVFNSYCIRIYKYLDVSCTFIHF